MNMKDFRRARKRVEVSVGESVRIVRELQGLTQNGLSKLTIPVVFLEPALPPRLAAKD